MKRALITGGAGFIGSSLAAKLLSRGWDVIALDDLSAGRVENIEPLSGHERFRLVVGDVTSRETVAGAIAGLPTTAIFHLAAIHYIPYCQEHPQDALRINVLGTQVAI